MKKLLAPFFLAVVFAVLATGCSSSNSITVGLGVELTGLTRGADGATQVTWRVVNPNVVAYLVAQASHKVYLDGVLVGTTADRDPLAVPAHNSATRTSALVTAGPAADRVLAAAAAAGSAAYRLESSILIRLYGESTDKTTLTAAGKVPVTTK